MCEVQQLRKADTILFLLVLASYLNDSSFLNAVFHVCPQPKETMKTCKAV